MTDDPVRLLDGGASELLQTLLSAAREEQPRGAALQRTLNAVGIGTVLATASASAASAAGTTGSAGAVATTLGTAKGGATSTFLVVVKWLSIGAITGTIASSAIYGVSSAPSPPAPGHAPVAQAQPTPGSPVSAPRVTAVTDLPEIPAPPAVVPPPAPTPAAPVASRSEAVDPGGSLSAEVAALDAVRQALASGDAPGALDLLNGYEIRFPAARMLPEALYLRLEAYSLKADKSDAEVVARRLLRVYPSSPHSARARAVLGLDK